jgi:hypothetical protein
MDITEIVQKQRIEIVDVKCDICDKSCKRDGCYDYDRVDIYHTWGYGSKKDGTTINCDICEDCWDKVENFIVNELKGNVRKECY